MTDHAHRFVVELSLAEDATLQGCADCDETRTLRGAAAAAVYHRRPVLLRILDRLDRDPGELVRPELGICWIWRGARNSDGYGVVRDDDGRLQLVHRLALATATRDTLAAGTVARHRCDNRSCARPAHLVAGTQADNVADMFDRGRAGGWAADLFGSRETLPA